MSFAYLTVDDILRLHEFIVEHGDRTSAGVSDAGDVSYALDFVREGHYGEKPESIHEKATHLLRLLVANHPFVDGNKRTALASVVAFYGLNGFELDYDDGIRDILKAYATDERAVDTEHTVSYLRDRAEPLDEDWQAVFAHLVAGDQQNGFTPEDRTEE